LKILFLLISSFSWVNLTWSQGNYWVEFTDKGLNASSSFAKEQFLSPNALNRRLFFNLPITNSDLPIDTNYIAAIYSLEAQLKYQSKWLNGIVVETSNSNFKNLTLNLPFVKRVVFLPSGIYGEGKFSWSSAYTYTTFILNVSVMYALYCLVMLFHAVQSDLSSPINWHPLGKFLCKYKEVFFLS